MTKTVIDSIIGHEGFRSHVYLDSQGYLSLGYGTTVGRLAFLPDDRYELFRDEGVGVTRSQARGLVKDRVSAIRGRLAGARGWWSFSKIRRDVLVEMAYQLGIGGTLNFKRREIDQVFFHA